MRNNNLIGNILKVAGAAALIYIGYKMFEKYKLQKEDDSNQNVRDVPYEDISVEKTEEQQVLDLIKELREKPNKTKNDKYNIELLEIKLKQIRSKK